MFTMQNLNPIGRFGFASIEPLLKKKEADEVRRFFETKPCYLSHSEREARAAGLSLLPLNQARILHHYGVHQRRDVLNAPHLLEIANRPNVLSLVKDYLGCDPVILALNVWWSFKKTGVASVAQRFHRDPSKGKVCALFVYLTDADEDSGPHIYVSESHEKVHFSEIIAANIPHAKVSALLAGKILGFNLVGCGDVVYALPRWGGAFDISRVRNNDYSRTFQRPNFVTGLGVVTRAVLRLFPKSRQVDTVTVAKLIVESTYDKDGNAAPLNALLPQLIPEYIKTFLGPAGTSLITEPGGLHKGVTPTKRDRLMFCARYAPIPPHHPEGEERPLRMDWESRLPSDEQTRKRNLIVIAM